MQIDHVGGVSVSYSARVGICPYGIFYQKGVGVLGLGPLPDNYDNNIIIIAMSYLRRGVVLGFLSL